MINFSEIIIEIIKLTWSTLGSYPFLFTAVIISFTLKTSLLILFSLKGLRSSKLSIPLILLLLVLIGGMAEDVAWIARLIQNIFFPEWNKIPTFFSRMGWAFVVVRYQALALFIENLSEKKPRLRLHQLPFLFISFLFSISLIATAFLQFNNTAKSYIEMKTIEFISIYTLISLMITSLII